MASQRVELGPGRHLILGANGAGKTSLIEAVYLLATTRSFRTHQLADCCRHGETSFALAGRVRGSRWAEPAFDWQRGAGASRTVDGKRTDLAEHLAVLPVLAATAADAGVLTGPPAERRRLLDRGMVALRPANLEVLARYRHALRAKRELLVRDAPDDELAPWDELLARAAAALIERRRAYAAALETALGEVLASSGLGLPAITLRYRSSPAGDPDAAALRAALATARSEERRARRPVLGPHRDDLEVRWAGRALRRVASAGERKALAMALVAAQGRILAAHLRPPVFLLDDADTELDRSRLERVWSAFAGAGQVLASSNRPAIWDGLPVDRRWHCADGTVEPE